MNSLKQALFGAICLTLLLWLVGLSFAFAASISVLIALALGVAVTLEPDNALKRLLAKYGKFLAMVACTVFLVVLANNMFGLHILELVTLLRNGKAINNVDPAKILQLSVLVIIVSGAFSYFVFYGGESGKRYRQALAVIIVLACFGTVWQIKQWQFQNVTSSIGDVVESTAAGRHLHARYSNTGEHLDRRTLEVVADDSMIWGWFNTNSVRVYDRDDNNEMLLRQTLTDVGGIKIIVRNDLEPVTFLNQKFVAVRLPDETGSYVPDPTMRAAADNTWVEASVIDHREHSDESPSEAVSESETVVATTPVVSHDRLTPTVPTVVRRPATKPSDRQITVTNEWLNTGIKPKRGDVIRLGNFPEEADVRRLEVRHGSQVVAVLTPMSDTSGHWRVELQYNSQNSYDNLEIRIKHGFPLEVTIQHIS